MPSALFSPRVAAALEALGDGTDVEPHVLARRLRASLDPEEARQAQETLTLRRKAAAKLAFARNLLLTRRGLEQSSDRRVAAARADRIAHLGAGRVVWDATSGIGGDTMALALRGVPVVASDRDPIAARCGDHNLRAAAGPGPPLRHSLVADALHPPLMGTEERLLILDPDRRQGLQPGARQRIPHPEDWSPPLGASIALAASFAGACIKLPPAYDPLRPPPGLSALPHSWQWVSLAGELKELALWTGCLAVPGAPREALALDTATDGPGYAALGRLRAAPAPDPEPLDADEAARVLWIVEPDAAVLGAGLIGNLAAELDGRPLGPGIAYLGTGRPAPSPLARLYRVLDSAPLDRRRVRAMLSTHDVGSLTVKKRGHPDTAEALAKRLAGKGARSGWLVVARLLRGHRAYLVEPQARDRGRDGP